MQIEKVIFRLEGSEPLAIFPDRIETPDGLVLCYGHEGNHSVCSPGYYRNLPKAEPRQFMSMKRDLERMGYELQII